MTKVRLPPSDKITYKGDKIRVHHSFANPITMCKDSKQYTNSWIALHQHFFLMMEVKGIVRDAYQLFIDSGVSFCNSLTAPAALLPSIRVVRKRRRRGKTLKDKRIRRRLDF